ncbi:hypothetical protein GCM10009596_28970 [Arthrobacter rhombi]
MSSTIPQSLRMSQACEAELAETYQFLHADPDLSTQERRTADDLAGCLEKLGLEVFRCGAPASSASCA